MTPRGCTEKLRHEVQSTRLKSARFLRITNFSRLVTAIYLIILNPTLPTRRTRSRTPAGATQTADARVNSRVSHPDGAGVPHHLHRRPASAPLPETRRIRARKRRIPPRPTTSAAHPANEAPEHPALARRAAWTAPRARSGIIKRSNSPRALRGRREPLPGGLLASDAPGELVQNGAFSAGDDRPAPENRQFERFTKRTPQNVARPAEGRPFAPGDGGLRGPSRERLFARVFRRLSEPQTARESGGPLSGGPASAARDRANQRAPAWPVHNTLLRG